MAAQSVAPGSPRTCLECTVLPPFSIVLCPVHAAAPDLLAALSALSDDLKALADMRTRDGRPRPLDELVLCEAMHDRIDAAFRKATEGA